MIMATKKIAKSTDKSSHSNPKTGQNTQDIAELQYILKSLNPLPALAVTILRLAAPLLARIAVRQAISYGVKSQLIKNVSNDDRQKMADTASTGIRLVIEQILKNISVSP